MTDADAVQMEQIHKKADEGCFFYFFSHKGSKLW